MSDKEIFDFNDLDNKLFDNFCTKEIIASMNGEETDRRKKIAELKNQIEGLFSTINYKNNEGHNEKRNSDCCELIKKYNEKRNSDCGELIMGEEENFVGADEDTFTKVRVPSTKEKMKIIKGKNTLTIKEIDNKLIDITYIRSACASSIGIAVGGISLIKQEDLIPTEEDGVFKIETSKLDSRDASSCITIGRVNTPYSILKLNDNLRIKLSSSVEFRNFVEMGLILKTDEEEINKIRDDWEKNQAKLKKIEEENKLLDGTIMSMEKLLPLLLIEVERLNSMNVYEKAVVNLESLKGEEINDHEKFRIASDIISTAREAILKNIKEKSDKIDPEIGKKDWKERIVIP